MPSVLSRTPLVADLRHSAYYARIAEGPPDTPINKKGGQRLQRRDGYAKQAQGSMSQMMYGIGRSRKSEGPEMANPALGGTLSRR